MHSFDNFDRQILNALQNDAHTRSEQIASDIGLSASAVQRRIRTLKKSGVLKDSVAVLDPEALGYGFTIVVFVETSRESPRDRQNLRSWCLDHPEVQQAYYVTGSFDLILIVLTKSIEHFDKLMTGMQDDLSCIRKVTTNLSIENMKTGLQVPVPLNEAGNSS